MNAFSFIIRETDNSREFSGVVSLSLPAAAGYFTILPDHGDLIAETSSGTCTIAHSEGEESFKLLTSGLFTIQGGRAVLIV
ncbi:MAG: hypothetical protein A2934_04990 [Candidatus Sungbacteria bacterium RIFCSPLOWO2_01_FULL_47_10]|uniref:ATP synthase F1 complex delta/epsilon subunit N-terminal domain-containing protein n=1 Tax=Candidatus Sungbacteria bacterium RIFCSPLOWO2_01_FULL_47_10 TaxID=1802276 RepID=A0A1G2L2R1_9BACT|nr:MAG: hypothetical protein A2934_04990 [Candidatus Sungbacteria bacterium RIFCSPLOWO2_01_FULL_47_10]